ncbi:YggS family pyridoxal phosphate-dependent enzyme [Reinekea thalattae]|uniref:Pyridoxal phosphate homeostasis protein n=1 Tax=Reinekea thalattae TaxID=2593301 RepID=A0A5C8YZY9_9GAMM|nr:YggS family pyridoxal phosphate-dependent enzyme [Reinekea thalattae]TXR51442.1 YggS family pyridoxal phosphate-dependent enzyme [Reinekea thalattae]
MSAPQLESQLASVNQRIVEACSKTKRNCDDVALLAVSKTKPLADIITLYQAGHRQFAENYAQEGVEKCQQAPFDDAIWHFIGPLQSNKTKLIAEHFDWVHTIDREKIARRLSDQRPPEKPPLNLLIQVNISQDPAKSGVTAAQAVTLAKQISVLPNVRLRGLMTILEAQLSEQHRLAQFQELKKLQQALIKEHPDCKELSMGMSSDFELAIQAGATMVRVGSDIFGKRS